MIYNEIIDNLNDLYKKYEINEIVEYETTSDELIQHLETIYNKITENAIKTYKKFKVNKDLAFLNKNKNNLSENIENMYNDAMTNKRIIEIKLNKGRRMDYIMNLLKICLVVSGCMVIFPILNKLRIINKNMSFIMWSICTLIMILVILYYVYIHISNRDKNNFNKFNFQNPNSELIAKSKIDVDLSEEDYARCKAFEEVNTEYDVETINNFNISEYKTPKKVEQCK
jgi:uncharacterized membrane protein